MIIHLSVLEKLLPKLCNIFLFDLPYGVSQNTGSGCSNVKKFLQEIYPKLPEDDQNASQAQKNTLEVVSMWVFQYIIDFSISMKKEVYELIPILCKNVEDPKIDDSADIEDLPRCLAALGAMRTCFAPPEHIPIVLNMVLKVTQSSNSIKTILAGLGFLQVFIFTNFMVICFHEESLLDIRLKLIQLLSHSKLKVRKMAAKIFSGLIHYKLVPEDDLLMLVNQFKSKISKCKKCKDELIEYHSGVLGLCAIVEAFPYKVPDIIPEILEELSKHLYGPQIVATSAKETLQFFRSSHQFSCNEDKVNITTMFHCPPDYIV